MSLLVFGRTGQVATELALRVPGAVFLGREEADLSDPEGCASAIRAHAPLGVINAAAYTAVDRAEDHAAEAHVINARAPGAMALACAEQDIPFLQISTDYVFDGSGQTPWQPGDPTGPLGVYGRSKLEGENAVRAAGGRHVILRTSWVFSAHGNNFLKTMLRLSDSRDRLDIVDDQFGGPTPAGAIADACLAIMAALQDGTGSPGTYHFAGKPDVSWKDFAREIFAAAGRNVSVRGIPTAQYPTPAQRPLNSRLDCSTLTAQFGITRPDWRAAVAHILEEQK